MKWLLFSFPWIGVIRSHGDYIYTKCNFYLTYAEYFTKIIETGTILELFGSLYVLS